MVNRFFIDNRSVSIELLILSIPVKIKLLKEEKTIMEDTLEKIALFAGLCGIRRGKHLLYFMNVNLEENRCEAK